MKKKYIYIVALFVIFILILAFEFRKSIFQCGNPMPYIEKMITLNEDKKFAKVYDNEEIYITQKGDFNDLHKYIERKYKVVFLEQMGSGYIFVSPNKTVILTAEIYWNKYEVWGVTIKKDKIALDNLSIR